MNDPRPLLPPELVGRLESASPRTWVSEQISSWFAGPARIFLLSGGPGTGKTMIAALALARDYEIREPPGRRWAASYFCSTRLRGYSLHPRQFIGRIKDYLLERYPEAYLDNGYGGRPLIEISGSVNAQDISGSAAGVRLEFGNFVAAPVSADDYFQQAVIEPLKVIGSWAPERRVGILIDGLDEAMGYDGPGVVQLLHRYAASLPSNCKLLLTSQNLPSVIDPLTRSNADLVHLDLSDPVNEDRVADDVRTYVAAVLAPAPAGGVDVRPNAADIAASVRGNFLQATGMLRGLVGGGGSAESVTLELDEYYLAVVDRLRATFDSARSRGAVAPEASWPEHCLPMLHWLSTIQGPLPIKELEQWLGWDALRLSTALEGVRPLVQIDAVRDEIRLEHSSVAAFLHSPVLPGRRPNPHGLAAASAQDMVLRRILQRLTDEWHCSWENADAYALSYCAYHLNRLALDEPGRAREHYRRLGIEDVARRIAMGTAAVRNPVESMAAVLRASLRLASPEQFESVLLCAARSPDAYLRSTAVDILAGYGHNAPSQAGEAVHRLLLVQDLNVWMTGLSAMMRLADFERDTLIRWIATKSPRALRRYAAFALYLAVRHETQMIEREVLRPVVESVSLLRPRKTQRALDFLSSITITAYTNHCDSPGVAEATSALWRRVTVDRLRLNVLNRPMLERPIVSVAARHLAQRIADTPVLRGQLGGLSPTEIQIVRDLLPGLTPGRDLWPLCDQLRYGLGSTKWVPRILSACVICVQSITSPQPAEALVEYLFNTGDPQARATLLAAHCVLLRDTPSSWPDRLERLLVLMMTDDAGSVGELLAQRDLASQLAFASMPLAFARHNRSMTPSLLSILTNCDQFVRGCALEALTVAGLYYPDAVLAALGSILERPDLAMRDSVVAALCRLRFVHSPAVDAFVRQVGLDLETSGGDGQEVDFAWRNVEVLGLYNNAVNQALHHPKMRHRLLEPGFLALAQSRDAKEFVRDYVPRVLSLLRDTDYELLRWLG